MTNQNAQPADDYLPGGTRVLSTRDGEPGVIMNGFATDEQGRWIEYEVETSEGVERWRRDELIPLSQVETE